MRLRHLYAAFASVLAALVLSGCYVYALTPPASNGPAADDKLVGAWIGLDEKGKPVANAFLHFTASKDGGPMHMVIAETDDYSVFETHTSQAAGKRFFAVRKLHPVEPGDEQKNDAAKYMLGAYDIRGDRLIVRIMVPEKLRDAVAANRVKGEVGTGSFAAVTLTGTPQEVARFLASPDAEAALGEAHTLARRLPPPR